MAVHMSVSTARLAAALVISSAASMALEIAASRMIAPYVGMSLYTWTAIIAVVLAGLAVGHWLGGLMADHERARRHGLFIVLALGGVTAFATQFLLRFFAMPTVGALAPIPGVIALTALVFFLPSLFAGAVGPLATYLAIEQTPEGEKGRLLGRMYALGAVGAIAGVLLGGLVLIPFFGSARSVAVISVAYFIAAALVAKRTGAFVSLMIGVGISSSAWLMGEKWSACHWESGYYCARVDDLSSTSRVLALDHLAHGVNEKSDPEFFHSPYVALIDEIAQRRFSSTGPESAFFIGGGAYTLPRAWSSRWPNGHYHVAEIDPMVTQIAEKELWVDPSAFRISHRDARQVLSGSNSTFDAIIGDAFADVSIPAHLVSDEFHREIQARLTPEGFYAMNVVDLLHRPRFLVSLVETLSRRFESVELWIDETTLTREERRTTWIVLASRSASQSDFLDASDGSSRRWLRIPTDVMLRAIPSKDRIFLTDDHVPIARLLGPLLVDRKYAE